MINLLIGAPGGGKSYEAVVYHVLPALAKGRKVVTNLPLVIEQFAALDATYPDLIDLRTESRKQGFRPFAVVEDWLDTWQHPKEGFGPLYVVDECHEVLPKGGTDRAVEEWFAKARHKYADVLLMTQSYGKISQAIRDLVQICYRVRKNVALGSSGTYTRKVQDGIRGEVVATSQRAYQKRYYAFYKSHTLATADGKEMGAADVRPIWKHWSFPLAGLCLVVVVWMLASGKVRAPWVPKPVEAAKQEPARYRFAATPPAPQQKPLANHPGTKADISPQSPASVVPVRVEDDQPYAGRGLHIVGNIAMGERSRLVVSVSQNGQQVAVTSGDGLKAAGYSVKVLDECVVVLTYHQTSRTIICDAPTVGIGLGGGGSPLAGGSAAKPEPQEPSVPPVAVIPDSGEWRPRVGYKMLGDGQGVSAIPPKPVKPS